MRNKNRKGMVYKTDELIFDLTDGLLYENSAEFAKFIGAAVSTVARAKKLKIPVKGHYFETISREFWKIICKV